MPDTMSSICRSRFANPKLWYPAGYGEQPLYEFSAVIVSNNQALETRKVKAGLRSVELHRELDKWGR